MISEHLHLPSNNIRSVAKGDRNHSFAKDWLAMDFSFGECNAAQIVADTRVQPLRTFDQIPMQAQDLLRQAKIISHYIAGKRVAFVGDNDGASRLIGLLGICNYIPLPASITLLDFDERILEMTRSFAENHGFGDLIHTRRYNVFDSVPEDLEGSHDWFYVNPPYGKHNEGESICLFLTRGMELCHVGQGYGCIIIPDDTERPWSGKGMWKTQKLLNNSGWVIDEKLNGMHSYHLDDDSELTSCLLIARSLELQKPKRMPYQGRRIALGEIPRFYGRNVHPPYPRFINADGTYNFDWV